MTVEQLKQYRSLNSEIEEINAEINSTYITHDVVKSSSQCYPYTQGVAHVEGLPYDNIQLKRLQNRKSKCQLEIVKIEHFIDSIEDSLTRRIFTLRYISKLRAGYKFMSWQQIANIIGGTNRDAIYKSSMRYLKKHCEK